MVRKNEEHEIYVEDCESCVTGIGECDCEKEDNDHGRIHYTFRQI